MMKIRDATIKDKENIAEIEYLSGYVWKMSKKEELKETEKILNSKNKFAYILEKR